MAFNASNFVHVLLQNSYSSESNIWGYTTSDTIEEVEAIVLDGDGIPHNDYFTNVASNYAFRTGDLVQITASNGKGMYVALAVNTAAGTLNLRKLASVVDFLFPS